MTRAERDKRYMEKHAAERAECARHHRQSDRRSCTRPRRTAQQAEMLKEELAASKQHASELSKQHTAALSLEDREALLA